jgi:hypothetical protein
MELLYNADMSHQLLEIEASRTMNKTMFHHKLHIYENKMVYRAREKFIRVIEITISYNHVAQVYLTKGIYFATLEIINTGGVKDIIIKYVPKSKAEQAKRIIDSKIHMLKNDPFQTSKEEPKTLKQKYNHNREVHVEPVEIALSRLDELLIRRKITKKEYEKKRKSILQSLK